MTTPFSYRSKKWPKELIKMWKFDQTHTKKSKKWIFSKKIQHISKKIAPWVRKIDGSTFLSVKFFCESDFFMVKNEHTCFFICFFSFLRQFFLEKTKKKKSKNSFFRHGITFLTFVKKIMHV